MPSTSTTLTKFNLTTKSTSLPSSPPPYLPPELLREIFSYLSPDDPICDPHLDLLSCALVCLSWQPVATEMIPRDLYESTLEFSEECSRTELYRLGELMGEARRLKLNIFDHVQGVTFDIWHVFMSDDDGTLDECRWIVGAGPTGYHFQQGEAAIVKMLEALSSHLSELTLDLKHVYNVDDNQLLEFSRIFSSIARHCRNVSKLVVKNVDEEDEACPILPLVQSLQNSLRSVELLKSCHQTLLDAIQLCPGIAHARITGSARGKNSVSLMNITKSWKHLESLCLDVDMDKDNNLGKLLQVAARSCPSLTTLEIIADGSDDALDIAIIYPLTKWHLESLTIIESYQITSWFLDQILLYGESLVYLCFDECRELSTPSVDQTQILMRNLKTLELRYCEALPFEFVELVIDVCPRLERLVLSEFVDDAGPALRAYGFESEPLAEEDDDGVRVWTKVGVGVDVDVDVDVDGT
ncbi:hypothetical protein BC936DRAFT_146679 [Jimgerdemannia flammicorona]|uniref:F-box domain-containing protein n=1 Tax=Jimgerdemannia flammicorona TaxID=994334 RepID=A0A433D700_9FUNG|nr:hypothetical protein BC936DRAFT_146679 [Jimgerdemannia flammicorona]